MLFIILHLLVIVIAIAEMKVHENDLKKEILFIWKKALLQHKKVGFNAKTIIKTNEH